MKVFSPIPNYKTLSVMLTFQCTAECKYCGTLSSPREKTWLPLDDVFLCIDDAAEAGFKVVVFTGGEATLGGDKLLSVINRAHRKGMATRLVTNAYWATTERASDEKLRVLVESGLSEINYSTGDEHVKFVPISNIIRAIRAAAKTGINVFVMIEGKAKSQITKGILAEDPEFIRIKKEFPNVAIVIEESPWMPLDPTVTESYSDEMLINKKNLSFRSGCDSILNTPTLEADGNIYACCGIGSRLIPELKISSVKDKSLTEAMKIAECDFLKRWIKIEGPEKILAWAASKDPTIKWENMYAHRCQACIRLYTDPKIREIIKKFHQEKIPDIVFNEWLLHSFVS